MSTAETLERIGKLQRTLFKLIGELETMKLILVTEG